MKTIKVLITTGLLVLMASCGGMYTEKTFFRSFVRFYYTVEKIGLESRTGVNGDKVIIIMSIPVSGNAIYQPGLCSYGSKGSEKELFDALCLKHNDMTYNRTITINFADGHEMSLYSYTALDFVSLQIVSDADFDEAHPAGADLGDVIRYANRTPKKYIDSGYVDEFDWNTADGLAGSLYAHASTQFEHPVDKLVSELTVNDMTLFRAGFLGAIQFERRPTLSQSHHLTLTMTTDEGLEFSASIHTGF